jgi:phosphate transport system protein
MSNYLETELENIKSKIFEMADYAIEAIIKSIDSLKNSDVKLAEKVINEDTVLDKLEVEIDDDCIKLLVTQQPAATDLRLVLALLKINTDIERIGDLATNIAKETIKINGKQLIKPLVDVPRMAKLGIEMINASFQAITEKNVEKAHEVIKMDEEIDELNLQIYRELFSFMAENPRNISQALGLIMVAKALERIGDHATNIAERAIYFIEGVDIRHEDA